MNTQYKKNLKDVATACKNYTDKKIDDLKWELGSHTLDVESDTTTAYTKTVPSGAIKCHINKIGGMSYKYNQLVQNGSDYTTTISGITVTLQNGKYTLSGTATSNIYSIISNKTISVKANHKYLLYLEANGTSQSNSVWQLYLSGVVTAYTINTRILNVENDGNLVINSAVYNGATVNCSFYQELIDLTDIFGAGNEPSDVASAIPLLQARGYKLNGTDEYNTGDIRNSPVTSVVSKDSNNTTLDTFTIPAEVQALEGYGWGVNDTCYNYVDFNSKKFKKVVGKYTFTGNEHFVHESTGRRWTISNIQEIQGKNGTNTIKTDIPNIYRFGSTFQIDNSIYVGVSVFQIADSTNLPSTMTSSEVASYLAGKKIEFELNDYIETDISEYIEDNIIEVEPNGTLTFTNTYEQAVPSDIDYLIEEVKA